MDETDRRIINSLQGDLPVCERPFLDAAGRIGISEDELLSRIQNLQATGVLSRVGPLFQIERIGGAFTLAALSAPQDRYDDIAAQVNALPQVAHNYQRGHELNMWFVVATETPEEISAVIATIERETGCKVYNFPKSREYFVELKLQA